MSQELLTTPSSPVAVGPKSGGAIGFPSPTGRCLTVMYHYIRPAAGLSDGVRGLPLAEFEEQLDHLCRFLEPIDWPGVLKELRRGGQLPAACFLLTFDDGLREHREHVAELLDRRSIRGVFFVPGVTLAERRLLSAHSVHSLLSALGDEAFEAEIMRELAERAGEQPWAKFLDETAARRMYHYETPARARMKYLLHMILPINVRNDLLTALFEKHVGSQREAAERLYLNAEDIRDLQRRGHTIGGHGYEHEPLTRFSVPQRRADLLRVLHLLNATLGRDHRPLAFPFGAFNADVCAAAQEAGFPAAFTTQESWLTPSTNPLLLPRVDTIKVQNFVASPSTIDNSTPCASPSPKGQREINKNQAVGSNGNGQGERTAHAATPSTVLRTAPSTERGRAVGEPNLPSRNQTTEKRIAPSPAPQAPLRRSNAPALRRFLSAFWLRPENALWMTLRSEALRTCNWQSPSIDLCCGDGVFSFLHHGGEFDPDFDVFRAGCDLERAGQSGTDMYDHAVDDYRPTILAQARTAIDFGTDLKPNLLTKAKRLNLYGSLLEHDHNMPLALPSDHFKTVYCNAAYWVTNIDAFLAELRRILRTDGQVVLHVKLDTFRKCSLAPFTPLLGKEVVDRIGGNRLASWPTLTDQKTWEQRFNHAGLSVDKTTPFATTFHASLWEVGLRPIAPLIARLANAAGADTRTAVKRDWVELFEQLCNPLCRPDAGTSGEPVEVQYVLCRA